MTRPFAYIGFAALLSGAAWAQSSGPAAKFDAADVHTSPGTRVRGPFLTGGRFELRTATMVDLIRTAYGVDADKVYGGPSWLEMDRFDIFAKLPPGSTAETRKLMLQALLADRFKLAVHNDTKPMPAYALTAENTRSLRKPTRQAKPDANSRPSGCNPRRPAARVTGLWRSRRFWCTPATR